MHADLRRESLAAVAADARIEPRMLLGERVAKRLDEYLDRFRILRVAEEDAMNARSHHLLRHPVVRSHGGRVLP